MSDRNADRRWMARAMALAERGRGRVGTNPLVGAVVVRGGRPVAEGWHAAYGGPHAEAAALAGRGDAARGAVLYVTLEPCVHAGKTPPCLPHLAAAGLARVVVGLRDPAMGGRGLRGLRRLGVRCSAGVMEDDLRRQNREYLTRLRTRRPFVTLKLAATLDGRIADSRGRSRWISSPSSRRWTRGLRGEADAVMVGSGTVTADDPRLSAPGGEPRLKVVVDGLARIPPRSRLLDGGGALVAVTRRASAGRAAALRARGARLLAFRSAGRRVPLRRLLGALYAEGVGSVLCEGGAGLAGALCESGLVDRLIMVYSPRVLGGRRSLPAVGGADRPLEDALRLTRAAVRRIGPDAVVDALAAHVPA